MSSAEASKSQDDSNKSNKDKPLKQSEADSSRPEEEAMPKAESSTTSTDLDLSKDFSDKMNSSLMDETSAEHEDDDDEHIDSFIENLNRCEWMAYLPEHVRNMPITQLAIPGSHDSFAYYLDTSGEVSPSEPEAIKFLCKLLGPIAKQYMSNWSITQQLDISAQLNAGIRYFDLRVASKKDDKDDLYCVHGLYGITIRQILNDMKKFLEKYDKEVVLLDFNHFYSMTKEHHQLLMTQITDILGYKMCERVETYTVTLNMLSNNGRQVIVFYHDNIAQSDQKFWSGGQIPSPWPDTMDPDEMVAFLDNLLKQQRPTSNDFFVFQGVMTPTTGFVTAHLNSNLRTLISSRAYQPYISWLKGKCAGPHGINICIMDFVDWSDYIITVLDMNYKVDKNQVFIHHPL